MTGRGSPASVRGMTPGAISSDQLATLLQERTLTRCSTCASAPRSSAATSSARRPCPGACWRRACRPGDRAPPPSSCSATTTGAGRDAGRGHPRRDGLHGGVRPHRRLRRLARGGPSGGAGPQRAEQGLRRARAARSQDPGGHLARAVRAHGPGPGHGHRRHAHPRGVPPGLPARRVEHARRRADPAHRRGGGAAGPDDRRALRRPHPLRISERSRCAAWGCPTRSWR